MIRRRIFPSGAGSSAAIVPLLALLLGACSDPAAPDRSAAIAGRVVLRGLSQHNGVVVSLAGAISAVALTDATGAFRFGALAPGVYALTATAPSTVERTQTSLVNALGPAATIAPDFMFSPLGAITGRAALAGEDGAPLADGNAGIVVVVPGSSAVATTDDAGRYLLQNVAVGGRDVVATALGRQSAVATGVAVAYAGNNTGAATTAPDLLLTKSDAAGSVRGKVLLGDIPAAGVAVTLLGTHTAAVLTDVAGAFAFSGVADGAYVVSASIANTVERTLTAGATVAAGAAVVVADFTFTRVPAAGSGLGVVSGGIKPTGRDSAAGLSVSLRTDDPSGGPSFSALTDENGHFAVRDVPAGLYGLTVSDGASYEEHVPNVLALPGAGGLLLQDGFLFPLGTIEVPRAHRLASLHNVSAVFAAPGDGAFLVFSDDDGAGSATLSLVRAALASSPAALAGELVTHAASPAGVWFSPTGDAAYFFSNVDHATRTGDLWRLLIAPLAPGVAPPPAPPTLLATRVSIDAAEVGGGARLLVVVDMDAGLGALALVDLASGTVSEIAEPVARGDVLISADTRRLAYVRDPAGTVALETVHVESGARRVLASGVDRKMELVEDPTRPAEPRVLYYSQRAGRDPLGSLHVAPLFGSGAAVTLGARVLREIVHAPRSSRLAFWSDFNDGDLVERAVLRVADLRTGAVTRVADVTTPGGQTGGAIFSPDASSLAFFDAFAAESGEGTLRVAPAVATPGRVAVTIATRVHAAMPGAPRFNADASRIVFVRAVDGARLVGELLSADTTTGVGVLLAAEAALAGIMIAPADSVVFLADYDPSANAGTLTKIALGGAARATMLAYRVVPQGDEARDPYVSLAGGTDLLVLTDFDLATKRGNVCRVPLAGTGPSVLAAGVVPHRYGHSPDGEHVLIALGYDAATESATLRAVHAATPFAPAALVAERVWLPEHIEVSTLSVAAGRVLVVTDHVAGLGGLLRAAPLPGTAAAGGDPMGRPLGTDVELADASFSQGGASVAFRSYDRASLAPTTLSLADTADTGTTRPLVRRAVWHGETAGGAIIAVRDGIEKPFAFQNGLYLVAR